MDCRLASHAAFSSGRVVKIPSSLFFIMSLLAISLADWKMLAPQFGLNALAWIQGGSG